MQPAADDREDERFHLNSEKESQVKVISDESRVEGHNLVLQT